MTKQLEASPCHLELEALEGRMMLSSVSILANGHAGEESMSLLIDNQVVQTWDNIGVESQTFTYNTDESISADQIRVAFTNDLYLPEQGVDRNLSVESVQLDGVVFEINDPGVLSVGVWNAAAGAITTGFGQGNTLHANGYFQLPAASLESIDFAGRTWHVVDGQPTDDDLFVDDLGELTLGGARGPLAISTQVDIEGGERYRLTLDARRAFISGAVGLNGPWSTVGINYYDDDGVQVGQETVEVNDAIGVAGDRLYRAPEAATSAFLWAWIDDFQDPNDVTVPLKISTIDWQLDDAVPGDTTPPIVELTSNPGVITSPPTGGRGSDVQFTVTYTDNVGLGDLADNRILVEGPNGYSGFGRGIAGGGAGPNGFFEVTYIPLPDDGFWSSNENGTYTITLLDGTVVDEFGNATAGRQLGTFEINIPGVDVG